MTRAFFVNPSNLNRLFAKKWSLFSGQNLCARSSRPAPAARRGDGRHGATSPRGPLVLPYPVLQRISPTAPLLVHFSFSLEMLISCWRAGVSGSDVAQRWVRLAGAANVASALVRSHRLPCPSRSVRRGLRPHLARRGPPRRRHLYICNRSNSCEFTSNNLCFERDPFGQQQLEDDPLVSTQQQVPACKDHPSVY